MDRGSGRGCRGTRALCHVSYQYKTPTRTPSRDPGARLNIASIRARGDSRPAFPTARPSALRDFGERARGRPVQKRSLLWRCAGQARQASRTTSFTDGTSPFSKPAGQGCGRALRRSRGRVFGEGRRRRAASHVPSGRLRRAMLRWGRGGRVPHRSRGGAPGHCPVPVTLRVLDDVPRLRCARFMREFRKTLRKRARRPGPGWRTTLSRTTPASPWRRWAKPVCRAAWSLQPGSARAARAGACPSQEEEPGRARRASWPRIGSRSDTAGPRGRGRPSVS